MSDAIDFELVNGWLRMCKEKHTKKRKDGIYCRRDDCSVPEGFQVIDCITGLIVPAPLGCTYVALSYVWGDSQASPRAPDADSLPAVVQDSILVTRLLEYRYLWVDRYVSCYPYSLEVVNDTLANSGFISALNRPARVNTSKSHKWTGYIRAHQSL